MLEWLLGSTLGKFIMTFLISMVPVVELRGGLPYGVAAGLAYPLVLLAAILGNMMPVPFIISFITRVFKWLRCRFPKLDGFISRLEARADKKSEQVEKYGPLGLLIFVAIPLPGTGAWTGALIAAIMKMDMKRAFPVILLGVVIAAIIMSVLTFGFIHFI